MITSKDSIIEEPESHHGGKVLTLDEGILDTWMMNIQ